MSFDESQIAKMAPKTSPNANDWLRIFRSEHEETLESMFGRVDDPMATFPTGLVWLRSTLFAPTIGRRILPAEIPCLLSLASWVSRPKLVLRCLYALEQIVADDKLDMKAHRLYADSQRVLADLKTRCPDVVAAREESRKALRERKERDEATTTQYLMPSHHT